MTKQRLDAFSCRKLLVSPSLLAADFANLASEVKRIEEGGADFLHIDVMDGHFVPNLSMGPALVESLRKYSNIPFDTHLMVSNPMKYSEAFIKAGADHVTFHIEADCDPVKVIDKIHSLGCSAGITLKPGTPASALAPVIDKVELVLVMTVEPGFGGQSFMADQMAKVSEIREMLLGIGSKAHIEVDGGLGAGNVALAAKAGANVIVAGTSVFRSPSGAKSVIDELHSAESVLAVH